MSENKSIVYLPNPGYWCNRLKGILIDSLNLIRDPRNWTTNVLARNEQGIPVYFTDEEATCWCSIGAINKVATEDYEEWLIDEALDLLSKAGWRRWGAEFQDIIHFNDSANHSSVIGMFEDAIKLVREEEAKYAK